VPLMRAVTTLGRGPDCDVTLESAYVSRLHARVERRSDAHYVLDLGGRNGVLVNGAEIPSEAKLCHGDEIRLANVEIWYMVDIPADEPTPLWPSKGRRGKSDTGLLLSVDESSQCVWIEEKKSEIPLSRLEFKLLYFLFSHRGKVCSREDIGVAVWGTGMYDFDMLYRLIQRIKEKIEPDPAKPTYIVSFRGVGYRLRT
jgi:pSer/pThr/pTyr-binding forkhead associated (FHA) protein